MGMGFGRFSAHQPQKPKDSWKALRRTLPWARPHLPIMAFGLVATLLGVYLGQLPPRIIQYTIDTVIGGNHYEKLMLVIVVYIGLLVAGQLIGALSGYWMGIAGQRLLHGLRMMVYDQFQALSLGYYDDKRVGDLMSRVTGDINQLEGLIINTSISLLRQIFGVGVAFYFMWSFSPKLALLVLIPVPLLSVGMFLFTRKIRKVYRSIRDYAGELSAKLQENLSGIRVIKAFNRERSERAQVEATSGNIMRMNIYASFLSTLFYPAISLVRSMGTVMVLAVGAYLIIHGQFTVGMLTAFLMYVGNFYQPIDDFIRTFDSIQRSLAAGERIFEVLDEVPAVQNPQHPAPLDEVRGCVEFREVGFRYATGEQVLYNVTIAVAPGQRVALVGHSGAGKTSFINLIPRFYDTTAGEVRIDGVNVRDVRQDDLRRHIALVLQETFLFNGTVRENLRFGRLDADDDALIEAAKAANAHDFIVRLPDGYSTQIGERGIKLSGGQKQRLAIARAVLKNPRILILDEATSSVDSESEFLIHQALDRLMEGRTTFIIAHRLSTIRHADLILVLENGMIVERGNHEMLYAADGAYAQMYRQQFWLDDLADGTEKREGSIRQTSLGEFVDSAG